MPDHPRLRDHSRLPDQAGLPGTLAAIAVGGAIGAVCRYGLAEAIPHSAGTFPWATFATNVVGCLLMGIVLAWLGGPNRWSIAGSRG